MAKDGYSFSKDPRAEAVVTGAVALIPARKYPQWLRQTFIWAPTLGVTALAATPGATTAVLRTLGEWQGVEQEPGEVPSPPPAVRAALAVGAGATMYATWRFSFWFDTAAENALRKLRVPAPRVAIAVAVGAASWWSSSRARAHDDGGTPGSA